MFSLFKRIWIKKKTICHVGAWGGNFGDSILQNSIRRQLCELDDRIEFVYYNCQKTEFTLELIHQINKSCDVIIIGGGGLIFNRPQDNSKSGWQWNIDINYIDHIKIPIVVYGIGYNKFEYDKNDFKSVTREHLLKTIDKSALFSVRNTGTKEYLVKLGGNASKIDVIPDPGMFAQPSFIKIPGIATNKVKIGINWTTDRENQTFPEPWNVTKERFLCELVKAINKISGKYDIQVFYIGHMGYEFDKAIIEYFKSYLDIKPIIIDECLCEIYPPGDGEKVGYLVDIYRQMDLVLGMRGHSNIVSFGQNTPCIAIGSHRKLRYFKKDIHDEENIIDIREMNNINDKYIYGKIEYNLAHLSAQKIRLIGELERQRNIEDGFNKKVISLLR